MAVAKTPAVSHFPATAIEVFLHEKFDLASIRSSFGPRRTLALRTFADFKMTPTKATGGVLEFASDEWLHRLHITRRGDFNSDGIEDLDVCFIDQGRSGASYYSHRSLIITRYASDAYAVALSFSGSSCETLIEADPES